MSNNYFNLFLESVHSIDKWNDVSIEIMNKYKGLFICNADTVDVLSHIWENHGFSSYNGGLFSTVNPEDYLGFTEKYFKESFSAFVFAKTCMGCLFVFVDEPIGKSIYYVNIHTNEKKVVSTRFGVFFAVNLGAASYWKRECYGKFELKVIEKFGQIEYDECYSFVPALRLGGSESIKNIQKVKVREQLEILLQLDN